MAVASRPNPADHGRQAERRNFRAEFVDREQAEQYQQTLPLISRSEFQSARVVNSRSPSIPHSSKRRDVGDFTLRMFEQGKIDLSSAVIHTIWRVPESDGVGLIAENGCGPGVRLCSAEKQVDWFGDLGKG
jgi:hypothetical protein